MNKLLAALVAGLFAAGAFAQAPAAPMHPVHKHAHKAKHVVKHNAKHAKHKAHHVAKAL